MQHDCNEDERYRPHQVNMFMRQNESLHPEIQSTFIKSPKNIHRCRHHEYQWLFYNLSPHDCKFKIFCDTFIGGDCENPYYVLQLFSIEQWNPESGVFHSEKEEKEIENSGPITKSLAETAILALKLGEKVLNLYESVEPYVSNG